MVNIAAHRHDGPHPMSQKQKIIDLKRIADKITQELGEAPPSMSEGIERFYAQYREGYPDLIRGMVE